MSAWGGSWGRAWGNAWGAIEAQAQTSQGRIVAVKDQRVIKMQNETRIVKTNEGERVASVRGKIRLVTLDGVRVVEIKKESKIIKVVD